MRAASYCDVTLIYYSDTVSMDAFIITMALSARAIQHGAHRHDRRGIYRCVLLRFRGRIEIDHSYGLRCRGLCCHSRHSTRGPAGAAASGRATAGPLVLCREWQHKPLQRRPYRGQFLYPMTLPSYSITWLKTENSQRGGQSDYVAPYINPAWR